MLLFVSWLHSERVRVIQKFEESLSLFLPRYQETEMTTETDFGLTPDQLAYIRAAHARYRLDEAWPQMLEALRKAADALVMAWSQCLPGSMIESTCETAIKSVRAAIAAAE